jgi:hypothetical protein
MWEWYTERTYRETEERDVHLRTGESIQLLVESKTTSKVTHSEHQQDVTEDTSNHTGLYDIDISLDQCDDGDEQLDHITNSQP